MDKKYYSISEVSKILAIKEHSLRHLDHLFGKKLTVIRGRRYYKNADIEILRNALPRADKTIPVFRSKNPIDNLMNSMLVLRAELLSAL